MSNSFYNHGSAPATGATLSSSTIRAEFDSVATGFDKLPTLTGNGSEVVRVNSGATALETVINTELQASDVHALSSKATPVDADEFALIDSAASYALAKLTWANLKATIKTYYDSLTTTLTNKTIALGSNTVSGTTAQFNTALSDGDFATLAGTETLTNKALNGSLGATTPSTVVATTIGASGAISTASNIIGTGGAASNLAVYNNNTSGSVSLTDGSGSAFINVYNTAHATKASIVEMAAGGAVRATIDSSGNVGIGVTPSAWQSTFKALEVGFGGSISGRTASNQMYIGTNNYVNSSSNYTYKNSDYATNYAQYNGAHMWYTATIGTAGNAITFTQAMTLDASGNLLVGTTSSVDNVGNGFKVLPASGNTAITCTGAASSGANSYHLYSTGASAYRFYVSYSGQIFATSTSISAISDETLKENVKDLETGLAEVMALRPRRFDWKNGDAQNVAGFVAQEVEQVLPELVADYVYSKDEDGNDTFKKSLKMGDILPTLVKAIQEQQAIITSLTARLEVLEAK